MLAFRVFLSDIFATIYPFSHGLRRVQRPNIRQFVMLDWRQWQHVLRAAVGDGGAQVPPVLDDNTDRAVLRDTTL